MDRNSALRNAKQYAKKVSQIMNPLAIMLYGSYAQGCARDDSDIDVAVIFDGFQGNKWEASTQLWMLTNEFDDRIEPVLLDTADDPSGFTQEVLRTGQPLYNAQ